MGPSFDGQIRLGVESNTENDYGEEAGDVARKLPVFPLARLPRRRWCPVEEDSLRWNVTGTRPTARPAGAAASSSERRK